MDRKTNPKSGVWLPMGAADEAEERRDEESVPTEGRTLHY